MSEISDIIGLFCNSDEKNIHSVHGNWAILELAKNLMSEVKYGKVKYAFYRFGAYAPSPIIKEPESLSETISNNNPALAQEELMPLIQDLRSSEFVGTRFNTRLPKYKVKAERTNGVISLEFNYDFL